MNETLCNICSDVLDTDITTLKCGQMYFIIIVLKWAYKYSRSTECPYCRQNGGKLKNPKNYVVH